MSFISTYNNLSVRDWQNPNTLGGNIYTYVTDTYAQDSSDVWTTYDGGYVLAVGGLANNVRIFSSTGSLVTGVYTTTDGISGRGIAGYGGNVITAVGSSGTVERIGFTNEGVVIFYSNVTGSWNKQNIWGGANNVRLGEAACITGDGSKVYATISNTIAGGLDINEYTRSGNTWSKTSVRYSNANVTNFSLSIATNIDGNILAVSDSGSNNISIIYGNGSASYVDLSSNISPTDQLGQGIAVNSDGSKILVGSPTYNSGNSNLFGRMFLIESNGNGYNLTNIIYPDNTYYANGISFGRQVNISDSGNTIITNIYGSTFNSNPPYGINVLHKNDSGNYILAQVINRSANSNSSIGFSTGLSNTGQYLYFTERNINLNGTTYVYLYQSI